MSKRSCNRCGVTTKLRKCGGCSLVYYCTKECQKADWSRHQHFCCVCIACDKKTPMGSMDRISPRYASIMVGQGVTPAFCETCIHGSVLGGSISVRHMMCISTSEENVQFPADVPNNVNIFTSDEKIVLQRGIFQDQLYCALLHMPLSSKFMAMYHIYGNSPQGAVPRHHTLTISDTIDDVLREKDKVVSHVTRDGGTASPSYVMNEDGTIYERCIALQLTKSCRKVFRLAYFAVFEETGMEHPCGFFMPHSFSHTMVYNVVAIWGIVIRNDCEFPVEMMKSPDCTSEIMIGKGIEKKKKTKKTKY